MMKWLRNMATTLRSFVRLAFGAVTIMTLVPSGVRAQATLGPAVAYHDDFKLGIGAGLNVPIQQSDEGVAIMANVSNTSDDFTDTSRTEVGLNLGGGLSSALGRVRPTVGAKIEIGGGRGFVVFGHLPFVTGR